MKRWSLQQSLACIFATLIITVQCIADDRSKAYLLGVGDSTADRSLDSGGGKVEIQATGSTSTVTLKSSRARSRIDGSLGIFTRSSFSLSSPINKNDELTDLATLDALSNSTTLSISFQRHNSPLASNPTTGEFDFEKLEEGNKKFCPLINEAYKKSSDFDPKKPTLDGCFDLDNVKKYRPDLYAQAELYYWNRKANRTSYGITGTVGYQSFEYFDPMDLSKQSTSKSPWSVKGFYGLLVNRWDTMFVASYDYQRAYKDQDSQTICPAADPTSGLATCTTGSFDRPADNDRQILAIEARRLFGKNGVSLKTSFDFEEDVFGIDLPIRIFHDPKKGPTGGIRVGWRDDTKDLSFGVFVGSSFSIF